MTTTRPLIVGFSDSLHDRAVCVFDGPNPVVAIEEERITRIKHGLDLRGHRRDNPRLFAELNLEAEPASSAADGLDAMLSYCLDGLGVDPAEPRIYCGNSLRDAHPWRERAIFVNHHLAHAASSFFASGFDEALVLVADGYGDATSPREYETVMLAHGTGATIRPFLAVTGTTRSYFDMQHSLGVFYRLGTLLAGFALLEEGKTMGLSAYGQPTLADRIGAHITYDAARVSIDNAALWRELSPLCDTATDFEERADIAASFQWHLERAMLHYARIGHKILGCRHLCLAGGVALNCVMNGRLYAEAGFDDVFVPPAPADNGIAFGAAAFVAHQILDFPRTRRLRRPYWGVNYPRDRTKRAAGVAPALAEVPTFDLVDEVARTLARGEIVAIFSGGAEFGPRALGHRSFFASPASAATRDFINAYVKHRELFRPLAPIVAEEDVSEWFDWEVPSPFMLFTVPARECLASAAPAVVHCDGTSRLQTVAATDEPFVHALVKAFGARTGCPVLLNTSLNGQGEPIVETPEQAVALLSRVPVRYLLLNDTLYRKADSATTNA